MYLSFKNELCKLSVIICTKKYAKKTQLKENKLRIRQQRLRRIGLQTLLMLSDLQACEFYRVTKVLGSVLLWEAAHRSRWSAEQITLKSEVFTFNKLQTFFMH